jgi:hypothetical protein
MISAAQIQANAMEGDRLTSMSITNGRLMREARGTGTHRHNPGVACNWRCRLMGVLQGA